MVLVPDIDLDREPLSDEPELENSLHLEQIVLLLTCLQHFWRDRQNYFAAANLTIFYQPPELHSKKFRGPDFFVVLDTDPRHRNSWVVANEGGKYPNVIVEILSKKTAKNDRTIKKELYQNLFQTPEYFWFDPRLDKLEFQGFRLDAGLYRPIPPNSQGWLWSEQLQLFLGVRNGRLRYFKIDGELVPNFDEATDQEHQQTEFERQRAEQERQQAELERQRAEQERQQAELERQRADRASLEVDRLKAVLRAQGIDPDALES